MDMAARSEGSFVAEKSLPGTLIFVSLQYLLSSTSVCLALYSVIITCSYSSGSPVSRWCSTQQAKILRLRLMKPYRCGAQLFMKNSRMLRSCRSCSLPCSLQMAMTRMSRLWIRELLACTLEQTSRRFISCPASSSRSFCSLTSSTKSFSTDNCSHPIASMNPEDSSYSSRKSRIESTCKETKPQASSLRVAAFRRNWAICLLRMWAVGSNLSTSKVRKCSSSKFLQTSCSSALSSSDTSVSAAAEWSQRWQREAQSAGPTCSSSTMRKTRLRMSMLLRKTQSSMVDSLRKKARKSRNAHTLASSCNISRTRLWLSFANSQISGVFLTSEVSTRLQQPRRVESASCLLMLVKSRCRQGQLLFSPSSRFCTNSRQAVPCASSSATRDGYRQHSRSLHSRMFCGTETQSTHRKRYSGFSPITVSSTKASGAYSSSVRVGIFNQMFENHDKKGKTSFFKYVGVTFQISVKMLFLYFFIDQTYHMLRILSSYLKLVHVGVIGFICHQICTSAPRLLPEVFFLQLGLTLLNILISKKHFMDIFQVVLSLNLTYSLIPNNYTVVTGLYFLKIIFVHNSAGEAIEGLLQSANNSFTRILKFVLNILRYTLVEFLFLGVVLLAYKVFTLGDKEGSLPEDYIILYKLIVTATTIGYGDITPKTKLQIQFFTYAIPFICASFVLYFNAVIPVIGELTDFLTGNATLETEEGCHEGEVLRSKVWSGAERDSFVNFIEEVTKRQSEHEEHNKRLGHNWIAVSANHYERQIPLISAILAGDEGKELKLKVSSKVRRQYYPKGWVILQAGDISEDLMMVDEGEVKAPAPQKKGFVFNREGFANKSPSRETIVTTEFVSIWAISLRDLEELSKTSSKIQAILSEGFKA